MLYRRPKNVVHANKIESIISAFRVSIHVVWHFISLDRPLLFAIIGVKLLSSLYGSFYHNIIHMHIDTMTAMANQESDVAGQARRLSTINKFIFLLIVYMIIQFALTYLGSNLETKMRPNISSTIRYDFYKAIKTRNYHFFLQNQHADIIDKLDDVGDRTRDVFEFFIYQYIDLLASLVSLVVTIMQTSSFFSGFFFNKTFALVTFFKIFALLFVLINFAAVLIGVVSSLLLMYSATGKVSFFLLQSSKSFSDFVAKICDSLNNIYSIKTSLVSREEDVYIDRFRKRHVKNYLNVLYYLNNLKFVFRVLLVIPTFVPLCWNYVSAYSYIKHPGKHVFNSDGIFSIHHQSSDAVGHLQDFSIEASFLIEHIVNLKKSIEFLLVSKSNPKISSMKEAITRLRSVRIENPDECTCGIVLENADLVFHNVSFSHINGTKVIKNLNLIIKEGERVGIAGTSGSGKSTLFSLTLRLFRPTEGYITLGGFNLNHFCDYCFGHDVSLIPQMPILFNRTMKENIQFSNLVDNVSMTETQNAARSACLDDIVMNLDKKYDFIVGNSGEKLSGGQRQRVAIARAFLKKSRLLLIDEATSALDSLTEHQVLINLYNIFANKTVLSIAHRLHTLKHTDRILVLEKGRIVEEGHFDYLINNNGYFERMWNATQQITFKDKE